MFSLSAWWRMRSSISMKQFEKKNVKTDQCYVMLIFTGLVFQIHYNSLCTRLWLDPNTDTQHRRGESTENVLWNKLNKSKSYFRSEQRFTQQSPRQLKILNNFGVVNWPIETLCILSQGKSWIIHVFRSYWQQLFNPINR